MFKDVRTGQVKKMHRQLRNQLDELKFRCRNCDEIHPYGKLEQHWESCYGLEEKKCPLCRKDFESLDNHCQDECL